MSAQEPAGPDTRASAPREFHVPSLDGIRCVAILLVFLSHVAMAAGRFNVFPGNLGVTLFFFLSGYLITTLLRIEHERTGRISVRQFYLRRVLRIFPPMYIVLALAVGVGLWRNAHDPAPVMDLRYVLGQALHLTNYQIALQNRFDLPVAPDTQIYWSLAVEEHFYLVFPWLFLALMRLRDGRTRARVLLGLCALVLLWRCWLQFGAQAGSYRIYVATDTRVDSILYGCALALAGNPALDPTAIRAAVWKWVLFPLALLLLLVTLAIQRPWFQETIRYSLQGLAMVPIYVVAVRWPDWAPMRPLRWGWVRWGGILSYTIYLAHHVVIGVCRRLVGPSVLPLLALSTAITLAIALLMYRVVERPAGRLRRKLSAARRAPA